MKKRRLFNFMLLMGLVVGVSGSLSSCKDYDGDSAWREKTATDLVDLRDALEQQGKDLEAAQAACRNNCNQRMNQLHDSINMNHNDIVDLKAEIEGLKNADQQLGQRITDTKNALLDTINSKYAYAINLNNQTLEKVYALDSSLTVLQNTVIAQGEDITKLYTLAYKDSVAAAKADSLAKAANALAISDSIHLRKVRDLAASNQKAIKALSSKVDSLYNYVGLLQKAMYKAVTSINVNGTYNPIFGYYAIPSGDVRSTVLAAYYGKPEQFTFPAINNGSNYGNTSVSLTSGDLAITGIQPQTFGGKVIVTNDGAAGNAGDMWLTLNPTSTNLEGKTFTLVKSNGEKSAMTLTTAQTSHDVLSFGYTRAGNGFYKVSGTVTPEAVEDLKPNFDAKSIETEVKKLYKAWTTRNSGGLKINFSELAGVLYNNMNEVLPAYALKTTWEDPLTKAYNSTLSQYSVAAAAVKPLSFGFLFGKTYTPLPVYTAYEDIDVHIDTIKVNKLNNGDYTFDVYQDGKKVGTVSADQLNKLIDNLNNALGGIQDQVNDQINNMDDDLNEISKLSDLIKRYDKWANRFNSWFYRDGNNHINRSLQPVLLTAAGVELGLAKLGNAKYGTLAVPSGAGLLATTYTLEMLAPAYKKWIAVTNVWPSTKDAMNNVNGAQNGNGAAKAALDAANTGDGMNTIINGTKRHVTLGNMTPDYVYEISYAAVDYTGKMSVRKFYVRGK